MTKRDVVVWFCKVAALAGIAGGVFQFLQQTLWFFSSFMGSGMSRSISGNFVLPLISFMIPVGVYFFLWLFSGGIGTEIAAEGEYGEPIGSKSDLTSLILRCAGLVLFLQSSISVSQSGIYMVIYRFINPLSGASLSVVFSQMWASIASSLLMGGLGFILAFGPRLRTLFRSRPFA